MQRPIIHLGELCPVGHDFSGVGWLSLHTDKKIKTFPVIKKTAKHYVLLFFSGNPLIGWHAIKLYVPKKSPFIHSGEFYHGTLNTRYIGEGGNAR